MSLSLHPHSRFCWLCSKVGLLSLLCLSVFLTISIRFFFSVDSIPKDIQTSWVIFLLTSSCQTLLGCLPTFTRTFAICPEVQSSVDHEIGELCPTAEWGPGYMTAAFTDFSIHLIIACFPHLYFQRHLLPPVPATRDSVV